MTHSICCYDSQTGLPARLTTGKHWPSRLIECTCETGVDHYEDGTAVNWETDAQAVHVQDPGPH